MKIVVVYIAKERCLVIDDVVASKERPAAAFEMPAALAI